MTQTMVQAVYKFLEETILRPLNWPEFTQVALSYQDKRPNSPTVATKILPALVCEAVGGKPYDAVPLCAAWIMYLLAARLFDDVQDHEGLWLNQPTLSLTDMTSFGLFAVGAAQSAIAHMSGGTSTNQAVSQAFGHVLSLAARAQAVPASSAELSVEAYFKQIAGKTGIIFATATWSGSRLATDDPTICQALYDYGLYTGMMIQILDDCDDLITDLSATGWSLPMIYALSKASPEQSRTLHTLLADPTDDSLQQAFDLLHEMGAITWGRQMARIYQQKALTRVSFLPQKQRQPLIDYINKDRNGRVI